MSSRAAAAKLGFIASAIVLALPIVNLRAETRTVPFYENFEPLPPVPLTGGGWDFRKEWHAFDFPSRNTDCPAIWTDPHQDYCPYDPSNGPGIPSPAPNDSWTWGPHKFESWPDKDNGGRVFSGQRSGRQFIHDPVWVAIYHLFDMPAGGDLRLKVVMWDDARILCDCDQEAIRNYYPTYVCDCSTPGPYPPPPATPIASRPNFDVNGGIELGTPNRRSTYTGNDKDFFFLGINTHRSWDHYCISSATDGWIVTAAPRTQGWHVLEIVIHPYTGGPSDVEFWMDHVPVGQAHRAAGTGSGVELSHLHLGGDPALVTENSKTNTFETIWYDEVALTNCNDPAADVDGDGFVDMLDFAAFQRCWTGPGNPFYQVPTSVGGWDNTNHVWLDPILFDGAQCQCLDLDGDQDVDSDDLTIFTRCASGPAVPATPGCDK